MRLLEAISPTARELLAANFFPVGYTWNAPGFGELQGTTVVTGSDPESALQSFRSKNQHLTDAWIISRDAGRRS